MTMTMTPPPGGGEEQEGKEVEGKHRVSYREAQAVREDLTKAMRKTRRKGIKEANFLRGMR